MLESHQLVHAARVTPAGKRCVEPDHEDLARARPFRQPGAAFDSITRPVRLLAESVTYMASDGIIMPMPVPQTRTPRAAEPDVTASPTWRAKSG